MVMKILLLIDSVSSVYKKIKMEMPVIEIEKFQPPIEVS